MTEMRLHCVVVMFGAMNKLCCVVDAEEVIIFGNSLSVGKANFI